VIAVPSLFLAHWFNTRVERYLREMVDVLEERSQLRGHGKVAEAEKRSAPHAGPGETVKMSIVAVRERKAIKE